MKEKEQKEAPLVMSVPEAGEKLGLSREGAYDAAQRGDFPTIKIGRLIKVPTARFERWLNGE
jgi:excisionase family DNA binding protein